MKSIFFNQVYVIVFAVCIELCDVCYEDQVSVRISLSHYMEWFSPIRVGPGGVYNATLTVGEFCYLAATVTSVIFSPHLLLGNFADCGSSPLFHCDVWFIKPPPFLEDFCLFLLTFNAMNKYQQCCNC